MLANMNVILLAKIFVLNDRGEILLMQRSRTDDIRPSEWDLPGGSVESGEDPNDTVLRELQEEAGLSVENARVLYVGHQTEPKYIVTLVYKGRATSLTVKLSHEHEQYQWIKPDGPQFPPILNQISPAEQKP